MAKADAVIAVPILPVCVFFSSPDGAASGHLPATDNVIYDEIRVRRRGWGMLWPETKRGCGRLR